MGRVASSVARLAGAALVLLLSAASGAPEDTAPLMVMRMQWLPQAFPSQACITPTAYCNGGQLNVCVGLGCDLWKNNTPHCIAQDPGPTNGGAAADEDIYARTDDGGGFKACQPYNHEPLPAVFNVASFYPAQSDGQGPSTACFGQPLNASLIPQELQARLRCIAGGVESSNQAWQQLWSTGGACTGMGAQDYFQLMADTFGAYDPARALAPGDLQINRSDLIAALSGTWGAEPWVACNASLGVGAETPLLFEVALCLNNKTKQPVDCPRDSLEATSGVAANACGEGYADGPLAFMPGTLTSYDCGLFFPDPFFGLMLLTPGPRPVPKPPGNTSTLQDCFAYFQSVQPRLQKCAAQVEALDETFNSTDCPPSCAGIFGSMPEECAMYADAKGAAGMGQWSSSRIDQSFDVCLDMFCPGNATLCSATPAAQADLYWLLLLSTNSDSLQAVEEAIRNKTQPASTSVADSMPFLDTCRDDYFASLNAQVASCVQDLNTARGNIFPGVSLTAANCPSACAGILKGLPPECAGFIACAGCYMGTDASRPADSDFDLCKDIFCKAGPCDVTGDAMAALGYFMMLVDPESSLWRHLALPPATPSPSPSPSPSNPQNSTASGSSGGGGSSAGATAGIVVGVVAGVAALAAAGIFVWRRRRSRGSGPAGKGLPGSDPTLNSYGGEVDTLLTSGRRPFGSISFSLALPPHARNAPVRPASGAPGGAAAGAAAGAAVAAVVAASSPKAGTPSSASMADKDALSSLTTTQAESSLVEGQEGEDVFLTFARRHSARAALDSAAALPSLAAAAALAAAFPRPSPASPRQSGVVYGASGSIGPSSPHSLRIEAVSPSSRAASLPQPPSSAHSLQAAHTSGLSRGSVQTVQVSGLSGLSMDGGQLRSVSVGSDRPAIMSRLGTQSRGMWDIPFVELQLRRRVGAGAFGAVYQAEWHQTTCAVKVLLSKATLSNEGSLAEAINQPSPLVQRLREEADIMFSLRHPNCVQLMGTVTSPPCLVTEYCGRGSLTDCLRAAKRDPGKAAAMTWHLRLSLALDAAKGMLYLHTRSPPIMHRDLKSPNLLVDRNWDCKVVDFGLSTWLGYENREDSGAEATNPRWLPPEVIQGAGASLASDVYAFGVVLWELITWEVPYTGANTWQIAKAILSGQRLAVPPREAQPGPDRLPSDVERDYLQLMQRCWAQEPEERPSFDAVAAQLRGLLRRLEDAGCALGMRAGSQAVRLA